MASNQLSFDTISRQILGNAIANFFALSIKYGTDIVGRRASSMCRKELKVYTKDKHGAGVTQVGSISGEGEKGWVTFRVRTFLQTRVSDLIFLCCVEVAWVGGWSTNTSIHCRVAVTRANVFTHSFGTEVWERRLGGSFPFIIKTLRSFKL